MKLQQLFESLLIFMRMNYLGFRRLIIVFICSLSFTGLAQVSSEFDGKYIGKLATGGFEDSLFIENGQLRHVRNVAWGYGVEHQFVYKMIPLKGEMITFEQVMYLKDRMSQEPQTKTGEMNGQTVVFSKDIDGNLKIIVPGHSNRVAVFKKVN